VSVSLLKKYEPKLPRDIIGQEKALAAVEAWLDNPRGKGLLAHGPPGVGKTSVAHAVARERDLELVEMNASDFRKRDQIRERLLNAAQQASLFGKGKLILVDEVDGLAGRSDWGATGAIKELIEKSAYPVYLTCNDNWDRAVRDIKGAVQEVEFPRPRTSQVVRMLEHVAAEEGLNVERTVLLQLASPRDIRSALTDLDMVATGEGRKGKEVLESLGGRDRGKNIFEALRDVFKARDIWQARLATEGLDKDIDEVMLWLDENIAREYGPADAMRAYEALSRADVFRGRIMRRQDWKLLKYVMDLSTAGVAMAKRNENRGFVRYAPPRFLQLMGHSRWTRAARKSLLEKVARETHTSSRVAAGYLQVVHAMAEKGRLPFELDDRERSLLG
jgi:replication factor C large subunit